MRSPHPPDRLEIEIQSRLGPSLAERGFRVVGYGAAGITWRRDATGRFVAGLIALGLFAVGGIASGEPASISLGMTAGVGFAFLAYLRRPATVVVHFAPLRSGGTEVSISGSVDARRLEPILKTAASVVPEPSARGPESPRSLWSSG